MQLLKWQDNTQTIVREEESLSFPGYQLTPFLSAETWQELLGALFSASQSQDPTARECAFRIFATTPGIIERQHENVVQEVFGKAFRDSSVNVS